MAPRRVTITWSPEAKNNLQQLYRYLLARNRSAAKRIIKEIRTTVEGLKEHPEIGRVVPEFESNILRERLVQNYRIIYTFSHDRVEIAAIWHTRELLS